MIDIELAEQSAGLVYCARSWNVPSWRARSLSSGSRVNSTHVWVFGGVAAFAFAGTRGFSSCIVLSRTHSIATGYYWLEPVNRFRRDDVVTACVPARFAERAVAHGVLARASEIFEHDGDGVEPVLKRVIAIVGDRVLIDVRGVFVDGRFVAGTRLDLFIDGHDCGWRGPVPHVAFGERVLDPGEVALVGANRSESWDYRYFGGTDRVPSLALLFWRT